MGKVAPKADVRWTMNFREKYAAWFREAKAQLEAHQHPAAFKTYPSPALDHPPWAPVRLPISKGRLGIVSTAALFRKNVDPPFTDTIEGDPQIIELPRDIGAGELSTAHPHIPQEAVLADVNVALPLDALRAMVKENQIGEIAPRFFSLIGYRTRADEVATETAPRIAAVMAVDRVTHALIVPV